MIEEAVAAGAADDPASGVAEEPDVPVAALDPVPVVPAVPAIEPGVEGSAVAPLSGPINVLRLFSTFEYASFQLLCVVISSLKFEISCEICVR